MKDGRCEVGDGGWGRRWGGDGEVVEGAPFHHLLTDDTPLEKRLKLRSYATVLVRGGSGGGDGWTGRV